MMVKPEFNRKGKCSLICCSVVVSLPFLLMARSAVVLWTTRRLHQPFSMEIWNCPLPQASTNEDFLINKVKNMFLEKTSRPIQDLNVFQYFILLIRYFKLISPKGESRNKISFWLLLTCCCIMCIYPSVIRIIRLAISLCYSCYLLAFQPYYYPVFPPSQQGDELGLEVFLSGLEPRFFGMTNKKTALQELITSLRGPPGTYINNGNNGKRVILFVETEFRFNYFLSFIQQVPRALLVLHRLHRLYLVHLDPLAQQAQLARFEQLDQPVQLEKMQLLVLLARTALMALQVPPGLPVLLARLVQLVQSDLPVLENFYKSY